MIHRSVADCLGPDRPALRVGTQQFVECARTACVAEKRAAGGELADGVDPDRVAAQIREVVCRNLIEPAPRRRRVSEGGRDLHQRAARAEGRMRFGEGTQDRRRLGAAAAPHLDRPALAGEAHRRAVDHHRLPCLQCRGRLALGFVEIAAQQRPVGGEHARVPRPHRLAQRRGETEVSVQGAVEAGDVAALQQIAAAPGARLRLHLAISGRLGEAKNLRHHRQPLMHVVRSASDLVPHAEGECQRRRITDSPRRGDRLLAQFARAPERIPEVQVEGEPRHDAGAQSTFVVAPGGNCFFQQTRARLVGERRLGPEDRRREAECSAGEQLGRPDRAADVGGAQKGALGVVGAAGALVRFAEREQELAAGRLVQRRRPLERADGHLVEPRRLLVGEQRQGAVAGTPRVGESALRVIALVRGAEVICQLSQMLLGIGHLLHGGADAARAARRVRAARSPRREFVEQRMREAPAGGRSRDRGHHQGRGCLLDDGCDGIIGARGLLPKRVRALRSRTRGRSRPRCAASDGRARRADRSRRSITRRTVPGTSI